MKRRQLIAAASMFLLLLSGCGGSGGGSGVGSGSTASGNGQGGTTTGGAAFSITYTHTTDQDGLSIISGIDFFTQWFVENADGSIRGPYTSGGTGVVDLGPEGRAAANLTMEESFHYVTYVGAPARALTCYTGAFVGVTSASVTLQNSGATGQMAINVPYRGWSTVSSDPFQFYTHDVYSDEILGNDNLANIFVSYRTSASQEPHSFYDFRTDLSWNAVGSQTFDVSSMKNYAIRSWSCVDDLNGDLPYVIGQRKGLLFFEIGRGVAAGPDGKSGTVGVPDLFPADNWYLASGSINPKVVKQFSLSSSSIHLVPLDRYIDANSLSFNASTRTFSFSLLPVSGKAGTDTIGFGKLRLSSAGSVVWDIYFPWSSVVNGTLTLPALPGYSTLPAFDFAQLEVYRLDGRSYQDMLLYSLNHMGYPLPSYAMDSAYRFLP
jgi:hypothetical protein